VVVGRRFVERMRSESWVGVGGGGGSGFAPPQVNPPPPTQKKTPFLGKQRCMRPVPFPIPLLFALSTKIREKESGTSECKKSGDCSHGPCTPRAEPTRRDDPLAQTQCISKGENYERLPGLGQNGDVDAVLIEGGGGAKKKKKKKGSRGGVGEKRGGDS